MPDDAAVLDVWERSSALERALARARAAGADGDEPVEAASAAARGARRRGCLRSGRRCSGAGSRARRGAAPATNASSWSSTGEGLAATRRRRLMTGTRRTRGVRSGRRQHRHRGCARRRRSAAAILERCMRPADGAGRCRKSFARRPSTPHGRSGPRRGAWLEATCPACGSASTVLLDPAAIVVEEVDRHARRILREVDQLARAYGWREPDVLALGPAPTPRLSRAGGVVSGYLERLVGRHAGPSAVRPRAVSRFEGDLVGRPVGGDPSAPEGPPSAIATTSSIGDRRATAPDRCGGRHGSDRRRRPGDRPIATARVGTDGTRTDPSR